MSHLQAHAGILFQCQVAPIQLSQAEKAQTVSQDTMDS